jgi:F0F1-type ATP synthase membrane subunit a
MYPVVCSLKKRACEGKTYFYSVICLFRDMVDNIIKGEIPLRDTQITTSCFFLFPYIFLFTELLGIVSVIATTVYPVYTKLIKVSEQV